MMSECTAAWTMYMYICISVLLCLCGNHQTTSRLIVTAFTLPISEFNLPCMLCAMSHLYIHIHCRMQYNTLNIDQCQSKLALSQHDVYFYSCYRASILKHFQFPCSFVMLSYNVLHDL